jgi:hypothetical protein
MHVELSQLVYLNGSICNYSIFQDREAQKFSNCINSYIYRGLMTILLPLMVTLIVDHSYFAFTQYIILKIKRSKCREIFSQ